MPSRRSRRAKRMRIPATPVIMVPTSSSGPTIPASRRMAPRPAIRSVSRPARPDHYLHYLGIDPSIVAGTVQASLTRLARSWWLAVDMALLLLLFLVCFRYPFGASYFFEISTFGLGAVVVLLSYALVQRILRPTYYLRVGLRSSVRSVFAGLVVTQTILSVSSILVLLLLALITGRFAQGSPGAVTAGAISLSANATLVGALTIALCTPATNRLMREAFLLWLVLALASYSASGFLGAVLVIARLPLLPFAACYSIGATGTIDMAGLVALIAQLVLVSGIVWFCDISVSRRSRLRGSLSTPAVEERVAERTSSHRKNGSNNGSAYRHRHAENQHDKEA